MRAYIASPLRANHGWSVFQHQDFARLAMAHAIAKGMVPFVPHLLYPQVLDPANPEQDALGISLSNAMLLGSQALWAYLPHHNRPVSAGMQAELELWMKNAENAIARLWLPIRELERTLDADKLSAPQWSPISLSPDCFYVSWGSGDARRVLAVTECFRPATVLISKGQHFFQPLKQEVADAQA